MTVNRGADRIFLKRGIKLVKVSATMNFLGFGPAKTVTF